MLADVILRQLPLNQRLLSHHILVTTLYTGKFEQLRLRNSVVLRPLEGSTWSYLTRLEMMRGLGLKD